MPMSKVTMLLVEHTDAARHVAVGKYVFVKIRRNIPTAKGGLFGGSSEPPSNQEQFVFEELGSVSDLSGPQERWTKSSCS